MTTPIYFGNRSITTTGSVGVGTTNPSSFNLQVVGTFGTTGDITAYYSDDRLKTRTGEITDALAKVKSLEGFIYRPNELATSFGFENGQHVGVSAQAVQRVLPEAIRPAPFDTDTGRSFPKHLTRVSRRSTGRSGTIGKFSPSSSTSRRPFPTAPRASKERPGSAPGARATAE